MYQRRKNIRAETVITQWKITLFTKIRPYQEQIDGGLLIDLQNEISLRMLNETLVVLLKNRRLDKHGKTDTLNIQKRSFKYERN